MAETGNGSHQNNQLLNSIKSKFAEIENIEEEIDFIYTQIEDAQKSKSQIKKASIDAMKIAIAQCFVELEQFVKSKKNELLLKVNELSSSCDLDEKFSDELIGIKQENRSLVSKSKAYLNEVLADHEYHSTRAQNEEAEPTASSLHEMEQWFQRESVSRFNANIAILNRMMDQVQIQQSYKFTLNSDVYKSLLNNIVNVGYIESICKSKDGDLVLDKAQRCELKSNYQYEFNNITLDEGSKLTVNAWNASHKTGGMLFIKCLNQLVMRKNSRITLSYKGYKGGQPACCGESYRNVENTHKLLKLANYGGGGSGISGAGAGYGTLGQDGKYSVGGHDYGDSKLNTMYMGSGGGASETCVGGSGGGSIWIYCLGDIVMHEATSIACNGQNGKDANLLDKGAGGGGSGGSIYLEGNIIKLSSTSRITASGGRGGKAKIGYDGSSGGDGRICIKVNGPNSIGYVNNIVPKPYIEYTRK